jgi:SAM-dependent methyltransferase
MIICPDCSSANMTSAACNDCKWEPIHRNGIADYFTRYDRENSFVSAYVENYEGLAQKNLEQSNIDRRFLRNQAKNIVKYVAPVKGKQVCDIGIGQGFLCDELLAGYAAHVTAIDVAPSFLARFAGSTQVTPYLANAESLPFKDQFDLVVATDVMEHVINVGSFLFCVNRALKMGGTAAIRVPYREGLLNYSPHRGYGHEFGHMRSFTKDILRIYMQQAGFKTLKLHLDGFSLGTPHPWLYSTYNRKVRYNKLYAFLNKRLEHPADSTLWNPKLAGLIMRPVEIVVVARKTTELEGGSKP